MSVSGMDKTVGTRRKILRYETNDIVLGFVELLLFYELSQRLFCFTFQNEEDDGGGIDWGDDTFTDVSFSSSLKFFFLKACM